MFNSMTEYDAYMRPVMKLGHCHYKGGGKSTTTVQKVEVAPESAEERQLKEMLLPYQQSGLNGARQLQNRALSMLESAYTPDWRELYQNYQDALRNAQADFNTAGTSEVNSYEDALKKNQAQLEDSLQKNAEGRRNESLEDLNTYDQKNQSGAQEYEDALKKAQAEYQTQQDELLKKRNDSEIGIISNRKDALDWNANQYERGLKEDADNYRKESETARQTYDDDMAKARADYDKGILDASNRYDSIESPAYKSFLDGIMEVYGGMKDVSNGKLSEEYAKNRQDALKDDLDKSTGSLLTNMARRGVVNSSILSNGLDSINQSASDTLAKNYSADLAQEAQLLQNRSGILQNAYTTSHNKAVDERNNAQGLAKTGYDMSTGVADKDLASRQDLANEIYDAARSGRKDLFNQQNLNDENTYKLYLDANSKRYDVSTAANQDKLNSQNTLWKTLYDTNRTNNADWYTRKQAATDAYYGSLDKAANTKYAGTQADAGNIFNSRYDLAKTNYNNSTQTANNIYNGAATAEAQSFYAPARMLDFAQNLYLPAQNQYNTMYSGRHGAATTSTTSNASNGNSGIWSAVGTVGGAMIACFTGKTKITTPDGYKDIQDIKKGDAVLSLDEDGNIVTKYVTYVHAPHKMTIYDVHFKNGTVWHTTDTQRYYDGSHFSYIDHWGKAYVYHGAPSELMAVTTEGKEDLVYDFAVDGLNVFFANDIAAEGYGD